MTGGGVWSVGVSLPIMQVPVVGESISEAGAATAQARPTGREWFFGDRESASRVRDIENRTTVGGLRRPVESLARVPGLRAAGESVRRCLERFLDEHPQLLRLAYPGQGQAGWAEVRARLETPLVEAVATALNVSGSSVCERGPHSSWRSQLVRAFVDEARDPEIHLATWLQEGAPIGVARPVPAAGIFPKTSAKAVSNEAVSALYAWKGGHVNYVSVRDHKEKVEAELTRLCGKGYILKYTSWEELNQQFQGVIVSKLAAITTEKPDGSVKLRLIVDMRRSGLNEHVVLNERILLPRLRDVVKDVMSLQAQQSSKGEEGVELAVVDFVDAYQTIGVHPDEQRHQVIAGFDGAYYIMKSVAFGGAGSPLIWGRAAAFLGRSGQALFCPSEARLEIYVDDPVVVLRGSPVQRTRNFTILLLWWLALGPDLSWNKIQRGNTVRWIGAEISVESPTQATITLPAEFIKKLLDGIDTTIGVKNWSGDVTSVTGTTQLAVLRNLAGRASWAAGIVPCFGAMLEPIWAVLAEYLAKDQQPAEAQVPRCRIAFACSWLVMVLRRQVGALRVTYQMDMYFAEPAFVITVDASPWGLGGFCEYKGRPIGWFADQIHACDIEKFGIEVGSHLFQTLLEALAVLVAVRCWAQVWKGSRSTLRVRSDSLSTLGAVNKLRSKRPGLATVMRELALDCSEGTYTLQILEHLPGTMNVWADALSRVWQPNHISEIPCELLEVTQCHPARRVPTWWKLQGGALAKGVSQRSRSG